MVEREAERNEVEEGGRSGRQAKRDESLIWGAVAVPFADTTDYVSRYWINFVWLSFVDEQIAESN